MTDTAAPDPVDPLPAGFDGDAVARRLEAVRERTLSLVAPLEWPLLRKQHVPILSPMVWDLGHIGNFEEMWLLRNAFGDGWMHAGYERMFDAVANPRSSREGLALPERGELFDYLAAVRERALARLYEAAGNGAGGHGAGESRLLAGGYVYELIAEHEEQHQETLLQALQAMGPPFYRPGVRRPHPAPRPLPGGLSPGGMVAIPAGPFVMGRRGAPTDGDFAYDNERGAHQVDLAAYRIDATPVTAGAYLAFVEDGGYERRELWSEGGWAWRDESGSRAPLYWLAPGEAAPEGLEAAAGADPERWRLRRFGRLLPVADDEPLLHVCWWEAEAYARWAGKRLATEAEWEKAALWDPAAGRARRYPWGDEAPTRRHANLDQLAFGPAPVGSHPDGASAYGVQGLVGDGWEWTASDFRPYPGFTAYPYAEYSEIFFGGDYRVLRGGSWATRPALARGSFRNWDFPIRRQIFAGFRCAADA